MAVTDQHIVKVPGWINILHIIQVVLSFIVLALTAYSLSVLVNILGTFGYNIFCSIYTFITCAYLLLASKKFWGAYNCWAALVLQIFGVIFWISAWASMAFWAAAGNYAYSVFDKRDALPSPKKGSSSSYSSGSSYSYSSPTDDYDYYARRWRTGWQCAAAAAGLGALVWVMFVITLITFSIFLHRHRKNPENANLPDNGSPAHEQYGKHEMHNVSYQA